MSSPKSSSAPAEKIELYEKMVATNPNVERKGATMPYTSHNGNMFSYLHPSGRVALRLPAEERETFLKKHKTTLFEAFGVVQKEYVTVPDSVLKNAKEIKKYFALSFEYVQTLKAKPAKKPGKKKI